MQLKLLIACALSFTVSSLMAQDRWGSWFAGMTSDNDGSYAATVNDSDSLLGHYCWVGSGNCAYLLAVPTSCKDGSRYPVLVNSDAGAFSTVLFCGGKMDSGRFRYMFSEFDAIDSAVRDATRIGVAMPLVADSIRVVRFDLTGSRQAISRSIELLKRQSGKNSGKQGTRDQTL